MVVLHGRLVGDDDDDDDGFLLLLCTAMTRIGSPRNV